VTVDVQGPDNDDKIAKIELFADGKVIDSVEPDATKKRWELAPEATSGDHYYFVKVTQADGQKIEDVDCAGLGDGGRLRESTHSRHAECEQATIALSLETAPESFTPAFLQPCVRASIRLYGGGRILGEPEVVSPGLRYERPLFGETRHAQHRE